MVKFIIGITGGSGVGKTTLIRELNKEFENEVSVFSLDNYYLPKNQQVKDENGVINFDLPTALDLDKLKADFDQLRQGNSIHQKIYGFNNPENPDNFHEIQPKSLLIVEGLFVMHYPFIQEALDYSVYLEVHPDIQLARRLKRDIEERNYSEDDIRYQWKHHVLPAYESFVKPYKQHADLIINNDEGFDENIHILTEVIHKKLG